MTTLLLLVLASTLLVGVARSSVRQAVRARVAQGDLQHRWGVASCREAVLPYAEGLLRAEESRRRAPAPSLRRKVVLGAQSFDLVVADEQAKANVNALFVEFGRRGAEDAIRRDAGAVAPMNGLRLRPAPEPFSVPAWEPGAPATPRPKAVDLWMTGYAQVFEDASPSRILNWNDRRASATGPAAALSCWGNGGLNVRRAPEALVRTTVGSRLSAVDVGRVVAARDSGFAAPSSVSGASPAGAKRVTLAAELDRVRPIMAAARVRAGSVGAASLVDGSTCHSLWVAADDGRRKWYTFTVLDLAEPSAPLRNAFEW